VLLLEVLLSARIKCYFIGVGVLELRVDSVSVLGVALIECVELVVKEGLHIRNLRVLKAQIVPCNH